MTKSIRFIKCTRVARFVFVILVLSIGNLHIAHAQHAVSPNESAAAVALNCFESWLDSPADIIPTVECMYRVWQIASCNHSRISTASLVRIVVRDIITHVLVWMSKFGIPDAKPETLRYADSIARPPLEADRLRIGSVMNHSQRTGYSSSYLISNSLVDITTPSIAGTNASAL